MNVAFDHFRLMNLSLRTVCDTARANSVAVPHNSAGVEQCLSWHVLGFCWTNCAHQTDHRVHTEAEDAEMITFCYVAP